MNPNTECVGKTVSSREENKCLPYPGGFRDQHSDQFMKQRWRVHDVSNMSIVYINTGDLKDRVSLQEINGGCNA